MLFNSSEFAVFFLAIFVAYWSLARFERVRVLLLLAGSYFFYGSWDWKFLGLIVFSTALDYSVGLAMEKEERTGKRRLLLGLSLVGNLGCLAFFKYWDFFATEFQNLMGVFGLQTSSFVLDIILPVGISFYTFQTLSYTIDVYRRQLEPERDFGRFALFVAFFPQLVAGPIVRARDFLPQIRKPPVLDQERFESGLFLVFWGLTKKIVLADYLGSQLVDACWDNPASYGSWATLLAIYGYAFQIYGDFSGYSDCAIGIARLLGFELCLNFNSPYRATSPSDFWKRWHISLSSWLRDYLYISLGGNRNGVWKTYRNLMLTMLLGGLWHGASWMFVIWGAYHGALLVVARLAGMRDEPDNVGLAWIQRVIMFHAVCLGWVFFRSATPEEAWAVLGSLFDPRGGEVLARYIGPVFLLAVLTHFPTRKAKMRIRGAFLSLPGFAQGVAYALLLGLLMNAQSLETPFIYFQF